MIGAPATGSRSFRSGGVEVAAASHTGEATLPKSFAAKAHFWNAFSAVFLFAARVAVSVIQLRYVEQIWGGAYSGLNVLSNQVLLYVTLLELGLAQAAISFLYGPLLRREHLTASAIVLAVRHDVRRFIVFGALAVFPVLVVYAHFVHAAIPLTTAISTLWLIALAGFVQLAAVHYQVYLNAAERLGWVNLILGMGYLVKTSVGLFLALHFHQYLLLPGATAALTLGEFACLRYAFHRSFPTFCNADWKQAAQSIRQRARYALIHKIAGLAYYQSDFIILSLTASLVVVKDYAKYQYASAALLSMVSTIATALTSTFARGLLYRGAESRRRHYFSVQFAAALVAAVLMVGYFFAAPRLVFLAFGQAPAIGWFGLGLFCVALFLNIVKTVDDMMLNSKGAFRIGFWIPILEVPLYIALGVFLSHSYGFVGVLLASILTNLTVSVFIKGFVLAEKVFDCDARHWFFGRALNAIRALALALPLVALHSAINAGTRSANLQIAAFSALAAAYGFLILRHILSRFAPAPIARADAQAEA